MDVKRRSRSVLHVTIGSWSMTVLSSASRSRIDSASWRKLASLCRSDCSIPARSMVAENSRLTV